VDFLRKKPAIVRAWRHPRRWSPWCLVALAMCAAVLRAQQAVVPPGENEVKALFFVTLARYTQWPTNAFPSDQSPIVLAVLGPHPIARHLPALVKDEKIRGRPLQVRRFASVNEVDHCHLLFLGEIGVLHRELALARLRNRPILTVSDELDFNEQGGMVETYLNRDKKIRFNLSTNAISKAGLEVSPALVKIAAKVALHDSAAQISSSARLLYDEGARELCRVRAGVIQVALASPAEGALK
jgi:hypothetical protein